MDYISNDLKKLAEQFRRLADNAKAFDSSDAVQTMTAKADYAGRLLATAIEKCGGVDSTVRYLRALDDLREEYELTASDSQRYAALWVVASQDIFRTGTHRPFPAGTQSPPWSLTFIEDIIEVAGIVEEWADSLSAPVSTESLHADEVAQKVFQHIRAEATPKDPAIPPCAAEAWQQFQMAAEAMDDDNPTEQQAYDFLSKRGDIIVKFETWSRYLRKYRAAIGNQKNTSRSGRGGRSIVDASMK